MCKQSLTKVIELIIFDTTFRDLHCDLVAKCFPLIEKLKIDCPLNARAMSRLLIPLLNLRSLEIVVYSRSFMAFPSLPNLDVFKVTLRSAIYESNQERIFGAIGEKLRNLTSLSIKCDVIEAFGALMLKSLQELTVTGAVLHVASSEIMFSVTTLTLNVNHSQNVEDLLQRFPNIQILTLNIGPLSVNIYTTISSMRFLKTIHMTCNIVTPKDFIVPMEGGCKNILIKFLKVTRNVEHLCVHVYYKLLNGSASIFESSEKAAGRIRPKDSLCLEFMQRT
ncbi:hypothetical protein B4U80_13139 [Leptotrombidium deliense]|uniref:Uncharacterized protein n=1 Tax=Leptotrombidium deliense TaxID=299467 RepID=A0A443SBW5_9ACAR|nr:hypothetical protein B4U80_13139 [Leptotrombidium deliense]